jgi:hypothetical protein
LSDQQRIWGTILTGNHGVSHETWGFPVNLSFNRSVGIYPNLEVVFNILNIIILVLNNLKMDWYAGVGNLWTWNNPIYYRYFNPWLLE